jgi:CRISPR-associated endonuclease/helicase Cas3
MSNLNFADAFNHLTGNPPFPWQEALYLRFMDSRTDNIPSSCSLPTGLGKTSVIAIWLIALANGGNVPRRLVYVVNRRTVVDQTTVEVEKYQAAKVDGIPEFAISTLRGQFADNREWSADPAKPAVICGTVDMIGSRLLFSGYGVGFKGRPLHAGFLGQDALFVHDEAHLEPAFQTLLEAIEAEQKRCEDFQPLRVMELTATSRGDGETFHLSPADLENSVVAERIHAKKSLVFHKVEDDKKTLADKILKLCEAHDGRSHAILVFVRTVETLNTVVTALTKAKKKVQQLTGTLRGYEREKMADPFSETGCPIFAKFLPPQSDKDREAKPWKITPEPGLAFLVCTSAGEVGVNISADHLICDLTPYDSMAQRFGRVNRFGKCEGTRIDIVHPEIFDDEKPYEVRRERTLALLQTLNGEASPQALGQLNFQDRVAAFTPPPVILPTTDILFDAWALTSIRGKLPGRPKVEPYLHGITDWEPPQTKVGWREEVWELRELFAENPNVKANQRFATELLEDYPLKNFELLADTSKRVLETLGKLPDPMTPIWLVDEDDKVELLTLSDLKDFKPDDLKDFTVLLPPQAGGRAGGLLNHTARYDADDKFNDVADCWEDKAGPLRQRKWDEQKPEGMRLERKIELGENEDGDALKVWFWYVRSSAGEASAKASKPYHLQPHLDDAQASSTGFVDGLKFPEHLRTAIILAAQFHDLGKDRRGWQRGIGNSEYPGTKLAKSGHRRASAEPSTYRHEFGSCLDVREQAEFKNLKPEWQELVLHLIAAHHGRARPHFTPDESIDENHHDHNCQAFAAEAPRRYARLQRKYGRWGLAYLESLVRAADIAASKKAEGSAP